MSWLSKYVFDPVKAMLARQSTSANPVTSAAGNAGLAAVANISTVTATAVQTAITTRSAQGLASPIVGALEDGLKDVVDKALSAALGEVPVVGAIVSPEAVDATNMGLVFLEQHAATYLASLFNHAKSQNVVQAAPTQDLGTQAS